MTFYSDSVIILLRKNEIGGVIKQSIQSEKYGEILYEESFWTGKKALSFGGAPLKRISKKDFQTVDGRIGTVKGSYLFGSNLLIDDDDIRLTPKITWYEIVLWLFPIFLITIWGNLPQLCAIVPVVGGAIGGAISALLGCVGLFLMRGVKPVWTKVLIGLATTAVTFLVCFGVACAIIAALI